MRKLTITFLFLCLVTNGIQILGTEPSPSKIISPQSEFINEGIGIGGMVVGKSTKSAAIAMYGDDYSLIKHNKYSYEIKYKDLGLSFYYCYHDKEKKIFSIEIKPPCHGVTSKGIIVGESTLQDVFNVYGKAEPLSTTVEETLFFEYRGVQFHIDYDARATINEITEEILKKKIITIEIVDPDLQGNACGGI